MNTQCVPEKPFNDLPLIPPKEEHYSSISLWKAAARYLDQLTAIGLLAKTRVGKENLYINKPLMIILKS